MNMEIIHLIFKLPLCLPLYLCYLVADKAGKSRVDEDLACMISQITVWLLVILQG